MKALVVPLLLAALGAASDSPAPAPSGAATALVCPATNETSDEFLSGGRLNVFLGGTDRALCDVRLRDRHRANAVLAGPDGTLYVAETARVYVEGSTDTGAVDVFAPDGRLVRRIADGIADPVALALDARNRLYVANTGTVYDRGVELHTAPHVGVYPPGAASPATTYPLPAAKDLRRMLLAPNGDLIIGDIAPGVIGRFRRGETRPLRIYRAPHAPLEVQHPDSTTYYPLDQRALRLRGNETLVALYGASAESDFFVEWSLNDGRVLRRVKVGRAGDLVIDDANRIIVSQSDGIAPVFPPGATKPVARFTTIRSGWHAAIDARGHVLFAGSDEVVALDATGRRVASYRFAPQTEIALAGAPRGSAPPSAQTPSPSLATPPPPSPDDVAAHVRGATGIAYDRISAIGLATAPPLDLAWADALRLPGATLRGKHVPIELVHVAILGPYARIADRDESIVEIVDCAHATVTSLSPARKLARFDVAVPDLTPRATADPRAGARLGDVYHPTIAVRANGKTAIDGRPAARYDVTVAFEYGKKAPAAFRAEPVAEFGAHTNLAFADEPLPALRCADLNVGPRGHIPQVDNAAAQPFATRDLGLFARVGITVAHTGPPLPHGFILAESGHAGTFGNVYTRVGNVRALTQDDAPLFAIPAGVRIETNAPVLTERF